jgi:hypothetical protein
LLFLLRAGRGNAGGSERTDEKCAAVSGRFAGEAGGDDLGSDDEASESGGALVLGVVPEERGSGENEVGNEDGEAGQCALEALL